MVSRADRSMLAEWWWTIDRRMLIALVSVSYTHLTLPTINPW